MCQTLFRGGSSEGGQIPIPHNAHILMCKQVDKQETARNATESSQSESEQGRGALLQRVVRDAERMLLRTIMGGGQPGKKSAPG